MTIFSAEKFAAIKKLSYICTSKSEDFPAGGREPGTADEFG